MLIEINNLTKIYGTGENAVMALSELDLDLSESEILIIRGPNGSGKSTLISILSGELKPSLGQILVNKNSNKTPTIATVKQFENLIPEMTIEEHFVKLGKTENLNLISKALYSRKPTQISRGEAQKVAIALALTSETDLLLADEPTGALSNEESLEIYSFIKQTAQTNKAAVIIVTHDENAEGFADRVIRLRDGRVGEVWEPGTAEKQVINKKGWVRIPEQVRTGMGTSVLISATDYGATLTGREANATEEKKVIVKRSTKQNALIKSQSLTTGYSEIIVSANLNFEVNENDIFCFFGKSGIGKTTLLKTICNLMPNLSGQLIFDEQSSVPYFNVEEPFGLELCLTEFGISEDLISKLELEKISARPLKTYSGGQLQRALIAIALAKPNKIIALDEPTSALDDQMCELVSSVLINCDKTLIISSHDKRLLEVASQVFVL